MAFNYSTGFINKTLESIATELNGGCIEVYTGTRPTTADGAINASKHILLGVITAGGGDYVSATNGLQFAAYAADQTIDKSTTQIWQFLAKDTGDAGWLRIKAKDADSGGVSTTALRIDGEIKQYGGDASLGNLSVAVIKDKIYTVDTCTITWAKV